MVACRTEHDSSGVAQEHTNNKAKTDQRHQLETSMTQLKDSSSEMPAIVDAPLSPQQEETLSGLRGKKIDVLLSQLGVPERIESARNFGMIFGAGEASVVFLYDQLKIRVYVMRDCTILGITTTREMKGVPSNQVLPK